MPALRRPTRTLLCLLLAMVTAMPAQATVILNTLHWSASDRPGWSGRVEGLFSGSGGNTERINFEAGGRLQWLRERGRYRLLVSGGYEESKRVPTARNIVVHLRHNHELSGSWSTVSFAQVLNNRFQRVASRWLLGFGPRYDFVRDQESVVALGATPMLEVERLTAADGHTARGRLSVFLHLVRRLSANAKLDAVAFWQPLFSDFSASRAVGNLALTVAISGEVDLKFGASVEDNARAPAGVERTDWSTFTGLGVKF